MYLKRQPGGLMLRANSFPPGAVNTPAVLALPANQFGIFHLFHGHYQCAAVAGNRFMQLSITLTVDGIATNIEYESSVASTSGQLTHFIVARGNAPVFDYVIGTDHFIHFYLADSIVLDGLTFTARGMNAADEITVADLVTEELVSI